MSLPDLERALRADAKRVGEGRITVDRQKALEKLRDYRLAVPHHYVLEFVRAAVIAGADSIQVRNDADDFEMTVPGMQLPETVLSDLLGHALAGAKSGDHAAWRHLGLGLAGALAMKPARILISSGGRTLRSEAPHDRFDVVDDRRGSASGTRIHVRERLGFSVLRDRLAGPPEEAALREFCGRCPIPLKVNGRAIQSDAPGNQVFEREVALDEHAQATFTLLTEPLATSRVTFDVYGVKVVERDASLGPLAYRVWVRDDRLRRNASGSDIVANDGAFLRLHSRLRAAADRLMDDVVAALPKSEEFPGALRWLVSAAARKALREGEGWVSKRARLALRRAPLLPGPAGEWYSIADFETELRAGRPVRFSDRSYEPETYQAPVVFLDPGFPPLAPLFQALLPTTDEAFLNVADEVARRQRRQENRAIWSARAQDTLLLPEGDTLTRTPITAEGFRGEVGLLGDRSQSRVRVVLDGRPISTVFPDEMSPVRVHAVIEGNRLKANESWDDVARDGAFRTAIRVIAETAAAAVSRELEREGAVADEIREHGRELLQWFVKTRAIRRDGRGARLRRTIPSRLTHLPLHPLAGGGHISLEELARDVPGKYVRIIDDAWPHPALDGAPIVVVDDRSAESAALGLLLAKECVDWRTNLEREQFVRRRMEMGPEQPRIDGPALAEHSFEHEDLRGVIAIPARPGPGELGQIELIREGLSLCQRTVEPLYGPFVASVEYAALTPTASWDDVVEDRALSHLLKILSAEQERLLPGLIESAGGRSLTELQSPGRQHLVRFMSERLVPLPAELTEIQRSVASAPLLRTQSGLVSLLDLRQALRSEQPVWLADSAEQEAAREMSSLPEGTLLVLGDDLVAELLARVFGRAFPLAGDELLRLAALADFEKFPVQPVRLPEGAAPEIDLSGPGIVRGRLGLVPDRPRSTRIDVFFRKRALCRRRLDAPIPLHAVVEVEESGALVSELDITAEQAEAIEGATRRAISKLIGAATELRDEPSQRLVLEALTHASQLGLSDEAERRLDDTRVFNLAGGGRRSWREISKRKRVPFVTERVPREVLPDSPVVLASDPLVERALLARGAAIDMTPVLKKHSRRLERREALDPVEQIAVTRPALFRRRFVHGDIEGEVALVDARGAEIELYERRLPAGGILAGQSDNVRAAANCDRLRLRPDLSGVIQNAALSEVRDIVSQEIEALFEDLAGRWTELPASIRNRSAAPLARALGSRLADPARPDESALRLPLLEAIGRDGASWQELIRAGRTRGGVPTLRAGNSAWSATEAVPAWRELRGRAEGPALIPALEDPGWAWLPREGEMELARAAGIRLDDLTNAVLDARRWLDQSPVDAIRAKGGREWREAIATEDIQGEVALPIRPIWTGRVDLYAHRRKLRFIEAWEPGGYFAAVNCDALYAAEQGRGGKRRLLRRVRLETERALGRLLERLHAEGGRRWWRFLRETIERGRNAPLLRRAKSLPAAPRLDGGMATVGQLLAEKSRRGSVAWVTPDVQVQPDSDSDRLVIVAGERERALCGGLRIPLEAFGDGSPARETPPAEQDGRRIGLTYDQPPIVRLSVSADGWRGELALLSPYRSDTAISLTRSGVEAGLHSAGPPAVGLLEHREIPVTNSGKLGRLGPGLAQGLRRRVDELYDQLVRESTLFHAGQRAEASRYVLAYLREVGVSNPSDLLGASGTAGDLAAIPLLRAADRGWVSLAAVADEVEKRGFVFSLDSMVSPQTLGGRFALLGGSWNRERHAEGEEPLRRILGPKALRPVSRDAWRAHCLETDPDEGTPLAAGLARLRKEIELVRASAPISFRRPAWGLHDVRLRRQLGRDLVRYDEKRRRVLLNADVAEVRRALEEANQRPDRIFALVVAIFGELNRKIRRISDRDEQALAASFLAHLAANSDS